MAKDPQDALEEDCMFTGATNRIGQNIFNETAVLANMAYLQQMKALVQKLLEEGNITPEMLEDKDVLQKTVTDLYAREDIKHSFKKSGDGLTRPQEKFYLAGLLTKVKRESRSDGHAATTRLKELHDRLPLTNDQFCQAFLPDMLENKIGEDSCIGYACSGISTPQRCMLTTIDPAEQLLPQTLLGNTEQISDNADKIMAFAVCTAVHKCLLCQSSGAESCYFERRSTYFWVQPYQAVLLCLRLESLLKANNPTPIQKKVLDALGERVDNATYKTTHMPTIVLEMAKTYRHGLEISPSAIKLLLGVAMSHFNVQAMNAISRRQDDMTWVELENRLTRKLEVPQCSMDVGGDDDLPAGSSSGQAGQSNGGTTNRSVLSCSDMAVIKVQCDPHTGCKNQPFHPSTRNAKTTIAFSTLNGLGLFAAEHIVEGTFVGEYIGTISTNQPRNTKYCVRLKNGQYLDGHQHIGAAKYANHTCRDPNCYLEEWDVGGRLRLGLFACKPIDTKTELLYVYEPGTPSFPCRCPHCVWNKRT